MTPTPATPGGLDLAPCPFCGSAKALYLGTAQEIYDTRHEHAPGLAVVCDATQGGCGATGGFETSPTRAKAAWNRRSQVSGGEGAPALRERLAALCHEQWSGWMKYLFEKCEILPNAERGDLAVIPEWAVQRWKRQMETPYASLSDKEKDSDRAEADRFLALLPAPAAIEYKQSAWADVRMQRQDGKPGCGTCAGNGWITIRERAYRCQECAPAVPDALTWTREKPTVEGFYWCRNNQGPGGWIEEIYSRLGDLWTKDMTPVKDLPAYREWAGPLPEPREAPPAPMNEGEVK